MILLLIQETNLKNDMLLHKYQYFTQNRYFFTDALFPAKCSINVFDDDS